MNDDRKLAAVLEQGEKLESLCFIGCAFGAGVALIAALIVWIPAAIEWIGAAL